MNNVDKLALIYAKPVNLFSLRATTTSDINEKSSGGISISLDDGG